MVRTWSIVLGFGLLILGLAGLSGPGGGSWVSWLDFIMGFFSFGVASTSRSELMATPARAGGPSLIALGLFVMWIIGLTFASASSTIVWWNFAFACAYTLLAIAAGASDKSAGKLPAREETHDEGEKKSSRAA